MDQSKIPTQVPRVALYIRVSSDEQAMHGLSLQAQRETLDTYAQTNGYKVIGLYADEGVTARKKFRNRVQFMRMLADVQREKIDLILFIKLDRWFRNVADYYEVQRILDEHHVAWIATEERYDTTTANGRLNLNIRLSIAQDESDRTGERIKFVFASKVQRGEVISGKTPFGYRIEDKRLAIDDAQAEIVRDIYNQYLKLQSVRALRKYVMDKYGIVYSHSGLRSLLQNEKYIGMGHGRTDWCPPLMERQLFDAVSRLSSQRSARMTYQHTDRVYLFRGLVFCAECGNRLSAHTVSQKYIYYRCCKYDKLHLCSHKKRTSELMLEACLLSNLTQCAQDYNSQLSQKNRTAQAVIDTDKIMAKLEKLKDLYLNDLIERGHYEKEYLQLRDLLQAQQVPEVEQHQIDIPALEESLSSYARLDPIHRKAFWSRVIQSVYITETEQFTVTLISP